MEEIQKPLLTISDQEKIMLTIIAQGLSERIILMVKNDFKLTINILEALKWSYKKDVITTILNDEFEYFGENKYLLSFLNNLYGEKGSAEIISRNAKKEGKTAKNCWKHLLKKLSVQQLEENELWLELSKRGEWNILAKHNRFDEIILNPHGNHPAEAAALLYKYGMIDRIIELKKFYWLTKILGGEEILWQYKQFSILYTARGSLNKWTEEDVWRRFCSSKEGQAYLYEREEYQVLLRYQCFDLFIQKQNWNILAKYNYYLLINWQEWLEKAKSSIVETELRHLFECAVEGKRWDLLADNKQYWLLIKNKQIIFCLKRLFSNKKLSLTQNTDEAVVL